MLHINNEIFIAHKKTNTHTFEHALRKTLHWNNNMFITHKKTHVFVNMHSQKYVAHEQQ